MMARCGLYAFLAVLTVLHWRRGEANQVASQETCLDIGVNEDDFECAGFSRDTIDALNAGIDETGYYFCHKEEIAMFLGQTRHEGGADATRQEEICVAEGTCDAHEFDICSWNPSVTPAEGKHYRGRGPIQLSWSCNYKAAGDVLGVDLVGNPDTIVTNDTLSWETALWFWNLDIGGLTAHQAATNRIFANTTRLINGALECDSGPQAKHQLQRAAFYLSIARCMGLLPTEENLFCSPDLDLLQLPIVNLPNSVTITNRTLISFIFQVAVLVLGLFTLL